MKETSQTGSDTFSFIYRAVAEYLVARRIITYINENSKGSKTDSILRYMEEISTPETFEFMEYISDIEWAIKPHIVNELFSNQPQEFVSAVSTRMDRINEILNLIEGVKNNSKHPDAKDNPSMGNLVTLSYLVSDFGKFIFKAPSNIKKIDFSNCNLKGVRLSHANLSGAIYEF